MKKFIFFLLALVSLLAEQTSEFDSLMGKPKEGWNGLITSQDLETLSRFGKLYEANKYKQFTESGDYKIPPTIHFIWLGPKNFPIESVENVRTWVAHHPQWKIKFWTDRERPPPCKGIEVCLVKPLTFLNHRYEQSENWGEKSDLLRMDILYKEGGVYVDHDADCLKPFDGLHKGYDLYACFEMAHPSARGLWITAGNGIIGSKPCHPILKKMIQKIDDHWETVEQAFPKKDSYSKAQLVLHRTYIVLTEMLEKYAEKGKEQNIVFPANYFYAAKGLIPLYSKHYYASSWNEDAPTLLEKDINSRLEKLSKKIQTLILPSISIFILALIFCVLRLKGVFTFLLFLILTSCNQSELISEKEKKYLETAEDKENYQIFESNRVSAKEKIEIPHVFHFLWTERHLPNQRLLKNIKTWEKKHKNWKIKLWASSNFSHKSLPFLLIPSQWLEKGIDYVKLRILYKEGGVILTPYLKPKKKLGKQFISFSLSASLAPLEKPFLSSSVFVTPTWLSGQSHHPILKKIIKSIDENWDKVNLQYSYPSKDTDLYRLGYGILEPFNTEIKKGIKEKESIEIVTKHELEKYILGYDFSFLPKENIFQHDAYKKFDKIERKIILCQYLLICSLSLLSVLILFFVIFVYARRRKKDLHCRSR